MVHRGGSFRFLIIGWLPTESEAESRESLQGKRRGLWGLPNPALLSLRQDSASVPTPHWAWNSLPQMGHPAWENGKQT